MTGDVWIAIAEFLMVALTLGGGVVWAAKNFMTRDEHSRICSEKNEATQRQLAAIAETLKEDRQEGREHRHQMANAVQSIGFRIAVIETQLKERQ